MASWGEFIAEIPIINKRSEGIFVKVDHVLDLWAERNQLRTELAKLKTVETVAVAPPIAEPVVPLDDTQLRESVYLERQRCAREVEDLVQTLPVAPEQRALVGQVLQAAAYWLRHQDEEETAEFLSSVDIPPAASAETVPLGELIPEATPWAEPLD